MTQVETRDTVDVGEALDKIRDDPLCVRISGPYGVAFIRDDPDNDSDEGDYLVNVYVPVVEERRTVEAVGGGAVSEAIKGAETAKILRVEKSPWSGNWPDEADEYPGGGREVEA